MSRPRENNWRTKVERQIFLLDPNPLKKKQLQELFCLKENDAWWKYGDARRNESKYEGKSKQTSTV